jgi:diacylglycerol kinase family enzyme
MPAAPAETTARPLVIANPVAGRGRTGRELGHILTAVRAALGPVDVVETSAAGHASGLAAGAAGDRRPLVISVGGDGTLSEITDGLMRAAHHETGARGGRAGDTRLVAGTLPCVGYVATGTGGDFSRALGIPGGAAEHVAVLAAGGERTVDVALARFPGVDGLPHERWWINVLSAGVGGLVDRYSASAPSFLSGRLSYAQATLRAIVMCGRVRLRCRAVLLGGETVERVVDSHAVAVCNGRTFGGGMNIAPMARPDDGLLDVIVLETRTRLRLIAKFRTVYAGTHLREPGVSHFQCRALELTPLVAAPGGRLVFPLDVDGDRLGDVPLSVRVLPGALRVRAPGR